MPDSLPKPIFAAPEAEPLILTGPPARLAGRLELLNPGSDNLVVRGAGLNDPSGKLFARQFRRALPTLVLRPDQRRTVPLSVAIDPTTPPGEYRVELEMGGQSRPAVLHVTEVFSLSLRPSSLVVANQPGRAQRKRVVITNTGNVAFTVGDPGEVDLKDDLAWERAIRLAVEPWSGRAEVDVEKLVVAVLEEVRRRDERAGSLVVRLPGGPVEVRPGETAALDLEITLSEGLSRSSRYRGRAPLLTQDLEIVVVSSGAALEGPRMEEVLLEGAAMEGAAMEGALPEPPAHEPGEAVKKPRTRSSKSTRDRPKNP